MPIGLFFLALLALPIAEIYVLVEVGGRFGIVNTIFALLAMGVLGAGLARAQGRYVLANLQATVARGETPALDVLQGVLIFAAGILFLIPGFVSDVLGLLLVLPGTRHLFSYFLLRHLQKKLRRGGFRVVTYTASGQPFGKADSFEMESDASRRVIDITPLSSESEPTSDSDGSSSRRP